MEIDQRLRNRYPPTTNDGQQFFFDGGWPPLTHTTEQHSKFYNVQPCTIQTSPSGGLWLLLASFWIDSVCVIYRLHASSLKLRIFTGDSLYFWFLSLDRFFHRTFVHFISRFYIWIIKDIENKRLKRREDKTMLGRIRWWMFWMENGIVVLVHGEELIFNSSESLELLK